MKSLNNAALNEPIEQLMQIDRWINLHKLTEIMSGNGAKTGPWIRWDTFTGSLLSSDRTKTFIKYNATENCTIIHVIPEPWKKSPRHPSQESHRNITANHTQHDYDFQKKFKFSIQFISI